MITLDDFKKEGLPDHGCDCLCIVSSNNNCAFQYRLLQFDGMLNKFIVEEDASDIEVIGWQQIESISGFAD